MYPVFQRNTYKIYQQRTPCMKLSKIALLLVSTTMLTACSFSYERHESHSEFYTHFETRDPISSNDISSSQEAISSVASSNSQQTSASSISSSVTTTNSVAPVADNELIISFYNPSCGSMSKEKIDTGLKDYMNTVASTTFVESIKNTSCQISNDIPTTGEKVLIIGSASSQGSLEFTFAQTIKTITITAQTYYKPWVDTWSGDEPVTYNNTDTNSVLYINEVHTVDLKSTDEKPVEKEYTEALNKKTLKLSTAGEEKSRVLIKSIKFVY